MNHVKSALTSCGAKYGFDWPVELGQHSIEAESFELDEDGGIRRMS